MGLKFKLKIAITTGKILKILLGMKAMHTELNQLLHLIMFI